MLEKGGFKIKDDDVVGDYNAADENDLADVPRFLITWRRKCLEKLGIKNMKTPKTISKSLCNLIC